MANTTIQLKHSVFSSNSPISLANGEIAINTADGKLFYRTPGGTISSIVTYPGPAGLNKEVQFNDAGVAGSNSNFTFDEASSSLNVTNINVTTRITTGSGTGGVISGADTIYANNIVANTGGYFQFPDGTKQYTANAGTVLANSAYNHANAAYNQANTATTNAATADQKAVSAGAYANAAYAVANSAASTANTDYTTVSATAGTYGNASAIPVVTLAANGRVTSISTQSFSAAQIGDVLALSIALG